MSSKEAAQPESKFRRLRGPWRWLNMAMSGIAVIVGIIGVFHIHPFGLVMYTYAYILLLVTLFLPLCFLWIPVNRRASRDKVPWYDIVLMVLACAIPLYLFFNTLNILNGWLAPTIAPAHVVYLCLILWPLLLEAARRSTGWVFCGILLFFSTYPLYGNIMPGIFKSPSISFESLVLYNILGEESFLGIPLQTFGKLVFGFMTFALLLSACGIGKFFNQLAVALLSKTRGGNAKVAIFASGLFSMISGSGGANVFATGVFTIPAMKKEGFSPEFAGAVEACASSAGTLVPPIMGSVAFIMAQFLEVPYYKVVLVAIVPAILYYMVLFAQIDARAARYQFKPATIDIEELPMRQILVENIHLIIGVMVLLFILFYLHLSEWAPWIATAVTVVLAMLRPKTRLELKDFLGFLENLGKTQGQMMGIMGPVGIMIGSFIVTGMAYSLPDGLAGLAGGNMYILLAMAAASSFILGMGITITAVYIFLAIVVAPPLVAAGFDVMAVHMFILYTGLWSFITPPVCTTCFFASILAESNPMKTGLEAMRLGIAKYLLPFFFIFSPALILRGSISESLLVIPTCMVGLILISGSLEGYIWGLGVCGWFSRMLFFISGALLASPGAFSDITGFALGAGTCIAALILKKKTIKGAQLIPF